MFTNSLYVLKFRLDTKFTLDRGKSQKLGTRSIIIGKIKGLAKRDIADLSSWGDLIKVSLVGHRNNTGLPCAVVKEYKGKKGR